LRNTGLGQTLVDNEKKVDALHRLHACSYLRRFNSTDLLAFAILEKQ